MKKYITTGLLAIFFLGLTGCPSKENKEEVKTDTQITVTENTVNNVTSSSAIAQQPVQTPVMPANAAEEAKAISTVIYGQVAAMNRQDMNGVLAALDPSNKKVIMLSQEELSKSFEKWRLHSTIKEAKLVELTADTAKVRYVQLTKRIAGSGGFRDNLVTGIHFMKKINGRWYIIMSQPLDIQFLDELKAKQSERTQNKK